MKKKGFTLIELLAVIVVLAIIALIATPIVMNTIEKSKKGAAERSADNYIDAVEIAAATAKLDGNDILEGTYTINDKGNLEGNGLTEPLVIEMNGNKPSGGTITIKDGQVTTDSKMTVGDYTVSYNENNKKYEATKKNTPSVEVLCKAVTTATTGNVPSGSFNYGDEYTCELGDNDAKTFFVLETNGDNVSLIMNANVDSKGKAITPNNIPNNKGLVAWVTKEDYLAAGGTEDDWNQSCDDCGNNNLGPITAKKYLSSSTASWTKLNQSQITLPTNNQLGYPFPIWLYDYLDGTTHSVSELGGYWTSTPSDIINCGIVALKEALTTDTSIPGTYGIRPVITISKSQLG